MERSILKHISQRPNTQKRHTTKNRCYKRNSENRIAEIGLGVIYLEGLIESGQKDS